MATPANPSFDVLAATTLQKYQPSMVENLLEKHAFFWSLRQYSMTETRPGSRSIVVPLMYGDNNTVKSYDEFDPLDLTPPEGISAAEFNWKHYAGTVVLPNTRLFLNSGQATQVINEVTARIRQMELSFQKAVNLHLFQDGTGNGGKDLTGLDLAVEDGTAWSTYGGIDSDANTFWRNKWFNFDTKYGGGSVFGDAFGESTKGMAAFLNMFNSVIGMPKLIVTTQDIYEAYERHGEGTQYRVTDNALYDAGFRNQTFKGVPMIFDQDVPAETVFFLDSEFLSFIVGSGRDFASTEFRQRTTQDARVAQTFLSCQLVVSKRDAQGRIDAVSV